MSSTYKSSGVDVDKASILVKKLEKITQETYRNEVISNPGGFCSLLDIKKLKYKDPILLTSTDGIGTKLKLAINQQKFKNLGFDLVGMCVNDILASGGEPLIFLDYFSSSKILKNQFLQLITSISKACKEASCSLVGGETAEMPGMYKSNEFDLAGFSLGVVEREDLLKIEKVKDNSILIGLESNGFHSNGFSLIRKILKDSNVDLNKPTPYKSQKKKLIDDLLLPTKIYVNHILPLIKNKLLCGLAHITGGGIYENLSRIIPDNHIAEIDIKSFIIHERFLWLKNLGAISEKEMLKTFNCGIGMILILKNKDKEKVENYFKKQKINYHVLGKVKKSETKRKIQINNFGKWHLK